MLLGTEMPSTVYCPKHAAGTGQTPAQSVLGRQEGQGCAAQEAQDPQHLPHALLVPLSTSISTSSWGSRAALPLPRTASHPSTQQCPSWFLSPLPRAAGRAYPGGRASRASTAARAGGALGPEAASSASPELLRAGRAGGAEPSAVLDTTGVGTLAPAAGLSSSMSTAPTASPFTGKAEGRRSAPGRGPRLADLPGKQSTGWVTTQARHSQCSQPAAKAAPASPRPLWEPPPSPPS